MNALEIDSKIKYSAFASLDEAITLLGLQDRKQEIIDFYNQSKYQTEQDN